MRCNDEVDNDQFDNDGLSPNKIIQKYSVLR